MPARTPHDDDWVLAKIKRRTRDRLSLASRYLRKSSQALLEEIAQNFLKSVEGKIPTEFVDDPGPAVRSPPAKKARKTAKKPTARR